MFLGLILLQIGQPVLRHLSPGHFSNGNRPYFTTDQNYFWLNFGLESKRDLNSFSCNNYKNSNIQKWSKCDVRPKETLLQLQWWTINKGSGCNAVGRAVSSAPESRGFNPAIGNFIYYQVFNRLYRIDKKEKEAWNCPFF